MNGKAIFVTGATGFIGKELIKYLLANNNILYVLIRPSKTESAEQRFLLLLEKVGRNFYNNINLVVGDVSKKYLGLSKHKFENIATKIEIIYHAAASVYLTAPIDQLRSVNVIGTQHVLELAFLAAKTKFSRFNYISTAYVAGKRSGVIYENELNCNQSFGNNYERSKFEAELLVEQAKQEIPICIYRPSMIMGDSKTGWTSAFNVLYGPIKMIYKQSLKIGPSSKKSLVDPVPVNYVIDSILYLSNLGEAVNGKTFHLTIGAGREILVHNLIKLSCKFLNESYVKMDVENYAKSPKLIHPEIFRFFGKAYSYLLSKKDKDKVNQLLTYINYTQHYKNFDNNEASKLLKPAGIIAPKLEDYLSVLCDYAVKKNFGKPNKIKKLVPRKITRFDKLIKPN